ncbi:MAG: class I SAM-dependent methyltransferase [Candidatus Latescibacterota bacterium]
MDDFTVENWYEGYFGSDYLLIDLHTTTEQEVAFLWEALRLGKGKRLLDVGCGYGRHLVPLLERGVNAFGCDLSAFMLGETAKHIAAAKDRAEPDNILSRRLRVSRLVQCDNRALPFRNSFDCAINMFNSFGYFAEERDNYRMLAEIAGALKPGGLFLLDLANRDFVIPHLSRKDWFEHKGAYILERKRFDPVRNRTEIDVHVIDKGEKRDYHHSIRLFSYTEISMLLEAAGFMVRAVFGGFGGEDFELNRDRMVILSQALPREDT